MIETNNLEILIPAIVSLIIAASGYFLGKSRDRTQQLFNKKLEIYSNIVNELSSVNHIYIKKNISRYKDYLNNKDGDDYGKNSESLNFLEYKDKIIKLFSPARLVAGEELEEELRVYFSFLSEYLKSEDTKYQDLICDKLNISGMEIEQLMRKDLLGFWIRRNYSKKEIQEIFDKKDY